MVTIKNLIKTHFNIFQFYYHKNRMDYLIYENFIKINSNYYYNFIIDYFTDFTNDYYISFVENYINLS
jgi:hypothetical protein